MIYAIGLTAIGLAVFWLSLPIFMRLIEHVGWWSGSGLGGIVPILALSSLASLLLAILAVWAASSWT